MPRVDNCDACGTRRSIVRVGRGAASNCVFVVIVVVDGVFSLDDGVKDEQITAGDGSIDGCGCLKWLKRHFKGGRGGNGK